MHVETFLGSFPWHRPLRDIGWRRFSRRDAETRSHHPSDSASPRLCGRICLMHVETILGSFQWHRPLCESAGGGSPAETQRRGDMTHQTLRLCASAGGSVSCTWRRSLARSNGIAGCGAAAGGDSPAETQTRGDMSQQPLRLCASAGGSASCVWRRSLARSSGIARCVNRLEEILPLRRRDAETWAIRLCTSAGGFASCAWRRSSARSSGNARCGASAG